MNIRKLDLYRKVPKELTQPTLGGATVSILCVIFMSYLLISELSEFLKVNIVQELYVDQSDGQDKIDVRLNVSLPRLECKYAGLDIQDDSGRHEMDTLANMNKVPINDILVNDKHDSPNGLQLKTDEFTGCRLEVSFQINKVPGNFHLSTHSASKQPSVIDMAHHIHEISFGDDVKYFNNIKGSYNALKNLERLDDSQLESHEYHLRIVPSVYEELNGVSVKPYQYTYAHKKYISFGLTGHVIPAVWFKYDINPISVHYIEKRKPFFEFLCITCAVIGGTFTVAGLWAGFVNSVASNIAEKLELGKLT